jgi:surface antigen
VRHSQRHLPYAVSTVLGLAAPALAAVLLTGSAPGLAAVIPPAAVVADASENAPHPSFVPARAAAVRPVAKPVAKAAPRTVVAHRTTTVTAPKPVTRTVRRTVTAPKPATKPAPKPSTSQTAQPWGTNDYPYKSQSDFYAIDKWGFTERQCVSFAAWRLAQHGDTINNRDNWGSAYSWDEAARRLGHAVSSKARVGAIAQWNAHESGAYYGKGASSPNGHFTAGGYGHVGWVKQVYSDGSALVEQYNLGGDRAYSVMRVKAPRYIVL